MTAFSENHLEYYSSKANFEQITNSYLF